MKLWRMNLPRCLLAFGLLVFLPSNLLAGKTQGSQILMAYEATLIVEGEVVYLGKPNSKIISISHNNYQVVVFRVREIFKGNFHEQFLKVNIRISSDSNGLSKSDFGLGKRFILLLEEQNDSEDCVDSTVDWKPQPEPDFRKYAAYPCYYSPPEAVIEASVREVRAIKRLLKDSEASPNSRNQH